MVNSNEAWLPESGRTNHAGARACTRGRRSIALSFIRTVTVGPGIAPDLLTPPLKRVAGARGLGRRDCTPLPPVGSSTPPWERTGTSGAGAGSLRRAAAARCRRRDSAAACRRQRRRLEAEQRRVAQADVGVLAHQHLGARR